MNTQATTRQIRDYLDHKRGNRHVRVHRDGRVSYYGSPNDTDRQHDYWHDGGRVSMYVVRDGAVECR